MAARLMVHLKRSRLSKPVDKWQISLRVEGFRREILQIREANRNYKAHTIHNMSEIAKHEKRLQRLKEIMVELNVLSGHSAG